MIPPTLQHDIGLVVAAALFTFDRTWNDPAAYETWWAAFWRFVHAPPDDATQAWQHLVDTALRIRDAYRAAGKP
jgi:hypothetical protein